MKKILIALFCAMLSTHAMAGGGLDGFLSKLNAQAKSDLANFSARISAQFRIPEAQVKVVIGTVKEPADAFMVFQLGKMASQPTEKVLGVAQLTAKLAHQITSSAPAGSLCRRSNDCAVPRIVFSA